VPRPPSPTTERAVLNPAVPLNLTSGRVPECLRHLVHHSGFRPLELGGESPSQAHLTRRHFPFLARQRCGGLGVLVGAIWLAGVAFRVLRLHK
jgi:hypothetical protein